MTNANKKAHPQIDSPPSSPRPIVKNRRHLQQQRQLLIIHTTTNFSSYFQMKEHDYHLIYSAKKSYTLSKNTLKSTTLYFRQTCTTFYRIYVFGSLVHLYQVLAYWTIAISPKMINATSIVYSLRTARLFAHFSNSLRPIPNLCSLKSMSINYLYTHKVFCDRWIFQIWKRRYHFSHQFTPNESLRLNINTHNSLRQQRHFRPCLHPRCR